MVKECMGIITNMTEGQTKILSENLKLSQQDEIKHIPSIKEMYIIDGNINEINLNNSNVVNIDGILLPIHDRDNIQPGHLVPVKSTINNLRSLALAVASGTLSYCYIFMYMIV